MVSWINSKSLIFRIFLIFILLNLSLKLSFSNQLYVFTNETDLYENDYNSSLSFNRTERIYINSTWDDGIYGNTYFNFTFDNLDYLTNTTKYICYISTTQGVLPPLNASISGNTISCNYTFSGTPNLIYANLSFSAYSNNSFHDLNGTWKLYIDSYLAMDYSSTPARLSLLTPKLKITNIFVDKWIYERNEPYLYYNDSPTILWYVSNIEDENHHGMAFNVSTMTQYNASLVSEINHVYTFTYKLESGDSLQGNQIDLSINNQITNYTEILKILTNDSTGFINDTYSVKAMILNLTSEIKHTNILRYGKINRIYFHIKGNATEISEIMANITYLEYNGTDFVQDYQEFYLNSEIFLINTTQNYTLNQTPESWFYLDYIPKRSGQQNITLKVSAGLSSISYSSFYVEEGTPLSQIDTYPKYYILTNQTFNITFLINATNGDLFNINTSLDIADNESIILLSNKTLNYSYYIENNDQKEYTYTLRSNKTGLVSLTLNIFQKNKTTREKYYFKIVKPIIELGNNTINFGENQTFYISILGNSTQAYYQEIILNKSNNLGTEIIDTFTLINKTPSKYCMDESGIFNTTDLASIHRGAIIKFHEGEISESPENVIDDYESSYWWGRSNQILKAKLNITLNKTGSIGSLTLIGKTTSGEENISIYYIDNQADYLSDRYAEIWVPVKDSNNKKLIITLNSTKQKFDLTNIQPFETNQISIVVETNNTNVIIYEFNATTIKKELNDLCYKYKAELSSSDASGTTNISYNFYNVYGDMSSSQSDYYVRYGIPYISLEFQTIIWKNTEPSTISAVIHAHDGDLKNINISLNILNRSVIEYNDTYYKTLDFLRNYEYKRIIWNITTPVPVPDDPKITEINVSAINLINNKSSYQVNEVQVIKEDINLINVTNVYLKYNKSNLYIPINITVEIQEDIYLENITLQYFWNNYTRNQTVVYKLSVNGTRNLTISTVPEYFNETANYSIDIYASDYNGTRKYNKSINITVYSKLDIVKLQNYTLYNRGENITFLIKDINGLDYQVFSNYNLTFTYILNNTKHLINRSGLNRDSKLSIFLEPELNISNYTLSLNVTSNNNTAHIDTNFTLSDKLYYSLILPKKEDANSMDKGNELGDVYDLILELYNVRYEKINTNASIDITNLLCLNQTYNLNNHSLIFGNTALNNKVFYITSGTCYAPNRYDTIFRIPLEIKDVYNNSLNTSLIFKTQADPASNINSGGGGGSSSSSSASFSLTENITKYEDRVVVYGNDTADIELLFSPPTTSLIQGETKEIILIIKNKKNMSINGKLNVTDNLDEIKLEERNIVFKKYGQKEIHIKIKTKLTSVLGTHKFKIIYNTDKGTFFNIYTYNVLLNKKIDEAKTLIYNISLLEKDLKEYINQGIHSQVFKNEITELNKNYNELITAIKNNDIEKVELLSNQIKDKIKDLDSKKKSLMYVKIIKNYKYQILFASIIFAIILELLIVYVIPLFLLNKKINNLRNKEKRIIENKKSIEKQYFLRQIDEKTFRDIIEKEQDKLVNTRTKLFKLEKEMDLLKKFKLKELEDYRKEQKRKIEREKKMGDFSKISNY